MHQLPIQANGFNLSELMAQLDQLVRKMQTTSVDAGLLYISLDNLAMVISSHGYNYADQIVSDLCHQIDQVLLNNNDLIARVDKDHICVVLENYTTLELEQKALEIFHFIINYGCLNSKTPLQLTTFIGGADFSELTDNSSDIFNKAYVALNDAKENCSHYVLYKSINNHKNTSKHQLLLANYLQQAFLKDRLHLAYQPIIDAKTKKPAFYECLLRIVDDNNEVLSVGPFIPVVEKMGFIDVIDSLAMKMAVAELEANPNLILTVNASNITLQQPKWLAMVLELLKDPNIAKRLIVEITETAEYKILDKLAYSINVLKQTGCKIAIDDFGTGNTSFSQIKNLPIDIVKIDGSFVKNMLDNSANYAFVQTLIELGQKLGFKTIAEFVETKEVAKALTDLKVDYMQGYYFAKPDLKRPWL